MIDSYITVNPFFSDRPRKPDIPGVDLANVFTLRTVKDANAIAAKFKDKHMVVLGTSFIGRSFFIWMARGKGKQTVGKRISKLSCLSLDELHYYISVIT